ncbi:MAG TPA: EEP domain-containing protein, partial [Thioalkalivibrio sp.]|nr:EEP domain-containing protein [Thioalkalivibrio sp.]
MEQIREGELQPVADENPPSGRRLRLLSFNAQVGIHSSKPHHYLTHSWKHLLPYGGRMTNLDRVAAFISAFDV